MARSVIDAGARLLRSAPLLLLGMLCALSPIRGADTAAIDYKGLLAGCHEAICLNGTGAESTPTHLTFHNMTIVYATRATVMKADLGEGDVTSADSKDSHWTLTGHVQIAMPQGHLTGSHATMTIVGDRITTLTAQGEPTEFERYADAPLPAGVSSGSQSALEHAHGHAHEIIYDVEHNQLELNGDAYLVAGCWEISSEHIVYDIADQKVRADPRDNSHVTGTVKRSTSGCGPGSDKS